LNKIDAIAIPNDILIGKDILELVSSSMYVDPLTIYREYIQNAADSIDEATEKAILSRRSQGRIDITLDLNERRVVIRDNGAGVPNGQFARRLTALGGSRKRGTSARGFRGIGRLAGLGYCQELIFRSRASGDNSVHELRWDCRVFKKLLQDHKYVGGIRETIHEVATLRKLPGEGWPEHFYEVELVKPIRIKNDLLLNREAIATYLSQCACAPFSPDFQFGKQIRAFLRKHFDLGDVNIFIDGSTAPIYRPYRDTYAYGEGKRDAFSEVEFVILSGSSGSPAAVGWLLHHGYHGSIPLSEGVGGLRARKGNIQVGNPRIFADSFPEPRFATWAVGEIHIIEERVIPNGRRDQFEQSAAYGDLVNQLTPIGSKIAKLCRSNSVARNRIKNFEFGAEKINERLEILEQGAVRDRAAEALVAEIRSELFEIKRASKTEKIVDSHRAAIEEHYSKLEERLEKIENEGNESPNALNCIPENERPVFQKMIALIYECSTNRVAAKALVDRILARLGALDT
jgi:molecular chaperone HtpG